MNNRHKYYLSSILSALSMSLISAIYVVYLRDAGLGAKLRGDVNTVFMLTVVLSEIPTGIFGDIIGHKRSVIIGQLVTSVGFVVYGLSNSFTGFALAEVLAGTGRAFISGSRDALLNEIKSESQNFTRASALETFLGKLIGVLGGLAGALIGGKFGIDSVWLIAGAVSLAGLMFTYAIHVKEETTSFRSSIKNSKLTLTLAIKSILGAGNTRWYLLGSTMATTAFTAINMSWAIIVEEGLSLTATGIVSAGFSLFMMTGSAMQVKHILFDDDEANGTFTALFLIGCSLLLAGILASTGNIYGFVAMFWLHEIPRAVLAPYWKSVAIKAPDIDPAVKINATKVSIFSMAFFLSNAIGLQIYGVIGEFAGLPASIIFAAPLILLGALVIKFKVTK